MRIQLPGGNPVDLAYFDGKTLALCLPLTPTQNVYDRMQRYQRAEIINATYPIMRDQVNKVLGRRNNIWSEKIDLKIIRCSTSHVPTDQHNVLGGCKGVIDLLQKPKIIHEKKKNKTRVFKGVSIVEDDRNIRVKSAEDRTKKHWNLPGPGTWFFIRKRRSELPSDQILDSLEDYLEQIKKYRKTLNHIIHNFDSTNFDPDIFDQYLLELEQSQKLTSGIISKIMFTNSKEKEGRKGKNGNE